jgi:hypothetical protein
MIVKGTLVTVRTTNGGEVTAPLACDYAPNTYMWSLSVTIVRTYGDNRNFEQTIPGYRVKSVEPQ